MPDISLRFNKDFLAVSSGVEEIINNSGQDFYCNLEYLSFIEPENIEDIYRRFIVPTKVPCVCLPTRKFMSAALRELGLNKKLQNLIEIHLKMANSFKFQHLLFELEQCPLPLDIFNGVSLKHYKNQYVKTAKIAEASQAKNSFNYSFDAWYLSNFTDVNKLKCALMGIAQVSIKPIFVSIYYSDSLTDFIGVANEFGAAVVGAKLDCYQISKFQEVANKLKKSTRFPLLVNFCTDNLSDTSLIDFLEHIKASKFNFVQSYSRQTFPKTAILASV